jgi:CelD/BcsL family acetyltransferase involved in cellulose biosynthesis
MQLYEIDPLSDPRWDDLVASHPRSSVFHQSGWLRALAETYGYRPLALTSSQPGGPLADGIAFCEVRSWITGRRLVSLPFSDHAEPLLNGQGAQFELAEWMRSECRQRGWKYVEFRPLSSETNSGRHLVPSGTSWLHTLDLTPTLEALFCGMHKSCLQRRIKHAERQQMTYERGLSPKILNEFYRLIMLTRRRFRLLPQPRIWFRNLVACMGANAEVRVVRKDGEAIAAILTLRHRGTVVYKYGCSDERFHPLAGMPLLFWRLIEESKAEGAEKIDFGRTDMDNTGLIRFKDRFGAFRQRLSYFRYAESERERAVVRPDSRVTRAFFSALPDALSSRAGRLVYRHIG